MSQTVLPNSINYNEQLPSLSPSTQNYTQVLQPINGSTFGQNQQIYVDIPSRGFIDPQSLYIRYKMNVTCQVAGIAADAVSVIGCPVYTPFVRVETYINSQQVDSVQDYNVVSHLWSNTFLGVNEKYGNQYGFGYNEFSAGGAQVSMEKLDSRKLPVMIVGETTSYFVSAPLICTKLANCEKFIPAFATGGLRLVFTLDTLVNMFSCTAAVFANINPIGTNITNFEVVYDMIDFGPEVEQSILAQPSIMIKSNGYAASSLTLPNGSSGTQTLVYNQRFASIRSAIVLPSGSSVNTITLNGKFDSVDITNGGYYSLNVGGVQFPQGGPINFAINKAGAMSELRKATGSLYDWSKSMSINSAEFSYTDVDLTVAQNNNVPATIALTSSAQPGKCYVGFDLNKINSASKNMLNGTSSQNSPINLTLSIANTMGVNAKNVYLVLNYDSIFILDPRTKMITLNQ